MPVTVRPADHPARLWSGKQPLQSAEHLLNQSCPEEYGQCRGVIQSSFDQISSTQISPSSNGFVRACYHAYSNHHHLSIRPEDVWFAILSQLSFHVNAHAEELRSYFVEHEGQKEVEVTEIGSIGSVDFGKMALRMTQEMDKHIVDPDLRQWILPNFTTTTATDKVTAAVLMMGAMQKYFSYRMSLVCGIPSVTLLGERDDWIKIQHRLDKLQQLGAEPEQFGRLLKPVIDHFVRSFDAPDDDEVREFWSKIAHQTSGSGPYYLSGWITAFCFWEADGKCLYRVPKGPVSRRAFEASNPGCEIDGTLFHRVNTEKIPSGFVSVPVTVDDNGTIYKTKMVAGSVGIEVRSSGLPVDESYSHSDPITFRIGPNGERVPSTVQPEVRETVGLDSIQPASGWWMYKVLDDPKVDKVGHETRRKAS